MKVFHCFAAEVVQHRQAGCQGHMILGNLRRESHTPAKPRNAAGYIASVLAIGGQTKTMVGIFLFFRLHMCLSELAVIVGALFAVAYYAVSFGNYAP
jgi:hypothetical protein